MQDRQSWVVHQEVAATVDYLLRGKDPILQIRTVDENGEVKITHETPHQTHNTTLSRTSLIENPSQTRRLACFRQNDPSRTSRFAKSQHVLRF